MEITLMEEQNPWWKDRSTINRDDKIIHALHIPPAQRLHDVLRWRWEKQNYLFIGPRQVGKTTFFKIIIQKLLDVTPDPRQILYFDCEILRKEKDIVDLLIFYNNLVSGEKIVFLDEITAVKNWESAIKWFLDSLTSKNFTIWITGSTTAGLKKERFPGRNIKIKLFLPLSFREFVLIFGSDGLKDVLRDLEIEDFRDLEEKLKRLIGFFSELQGLFEKYLICGGFPASFYSYFFEGKIHDEIYDIYYNWILGDISKLERSTKIFQSVILGAMKVYGTSFSLTSIAKEMEVSSHVTVRDYLELCEDLIIGRNYFKYVFHKKVPAFWKNRKFYFIDPFLYWVFSKKILGKSLQDEEKLSFLAEGIVGEHLTRKFSKVFYYKDYKEIDFILTNNDLVGIEVKWGKARAEDFPKIDIPVKIILSKRELEMTKDVYIIPLSVFLALLKF